MNDIPVSTIAKYFEKLDDPRIDRTKLHLLSDILVIAICAIICDADGWVDVENYGTSKYAWLTTFLALPNGIPSHDTFGRVFAHIDPIQFQHCFMRWMRAIYQVTHGEVVPLEVKPFVIHLIPQLGFHRSIWLVPGPPTIAWCSVR